VTSRGLLLDTCAIIFIWSNRHLSRATATTIDDASRKGELFLSPISSWEIGRSVAKRRLSLTADPLTFFTRFMDGAPAKLCDMGPSTLVASSFLPGNVHNDPFDRILIETARKNDLILVTSDRAILAYSEAGHVRTLAC
jgi:PIN domain nuclease of toxin-antitoxin system